MASAMETTPLLDENVICEELEQDLDGANVFICSLIFVQELAEKLVEVVAPRRDSLDACLCFPSMPDVMKLNKLGTFDLTAISGGPLGSFAQRTVQHNNSSPHVPTPHPWGVAGPLLVTMLL